MTTSTVAAGSSKISSRSVRVQSELQAALGGPFEVWRRGDSVWTRVGSNGLPDAISANTPAISVLSDWFDELATDRPTEPQLLTLPGGGRMAAAVVDGEDAEAEVVAGLVTIDHERLISRAAALAAQHADTAAQQELVDQYAVRLSACYEELTFLRRLSRHIEYCVADRSLGDVAQSVLPQLQELTAVEGLCLISAFQSATGAVKADRLTDLVGTLPGPNEFWCDFVDRQGEANRRVVVKNFRGGLAHDEATVPAELRSTVLAPIQKDGVVFGWLLGANKQVDPQDVSPPANSLGSDEIGSMEASLLESAALMLGSHAANHRLFREMDALVVDVIHTLVGVIEAKDAYTCGHSDRVALVARRLGQEYGLSPHECQDIFLAGLLHDIGKIGVPDDVLLKPGKLSKTEFEEIQKHPATGARLLQGLRPLEKLIPGVLHHHEAVDGSGYPYGLEGDQIPLMARVLAVSDAFDAMTSDRPYRPGMPLEKAEAILRDGAGKQWDRQVVAAFFSARDDIVKTSVMWREHLNRLLNRRMQSPNDRVVVGALSLAAALDELDEMRVPRTNAAWPGGQP